MITLEIKPFPGVNLDGVNGNSPKNQDVSQLVVVSTKLLEKLPQPDLTINVGCSMNHVMMTLNLILIVLASICKIMLSMLVLMINVTGTMK